jgi:hypothetical protein
MFKNHSSTRFLAEQSHRESQGTTMNRGFTLKIVNLLSLFAVTVLMISTAIPVQASAAIAAPLTITPSADSQVTEATPGKNYGNTTYLQVDGDSGARVESYILFDVSGLSGPVSGAKLRIYDRGNGSTNGPELYGTDTSWTESGLTWSNRPGRTSAMLGDLGNVGANVWVEYDVTSLITGNGTYSFVLAADSNDGLTFSSRQDAQPPQLVLTSTTNPAPLPPTPTPTAPTPTAPPASNSTVLVGAGDISSCSNNNDEATAKLLDNIPGTVFTAGDNAYTSGTSTEFQNCYEPTWGRHKARTKPVPGNHEYNTSGAAGYFQYFNNIASYYAYDLGSWRIYALNSEIDTSATSTQVKWLQADLAANPRQCVLAYWHRPRWSSGKHGNNPDVQPLWEALYNAGAELVLNGHDHSYERFTRMNANGSAATLGMREIVVGTGGAGLYAFGTILPTSQSRNASAHGVLKLTLNATGYDWQFIPVAGKSFTDSGSTGCR